MRGLPLSVDPNPAVEGQDINVSFAGKEQLYYSVDGGEWEPIQLDSKGNATIQAPVGAESIVISDGQFPTKNNVEVEIYTTGT